MFNPNVNFKGSVMMALFLISDTFYQYFHVINSFYQTILKNNFSPQKMPLD